MSVTGKPTSQDLAIEDACGAPLAQLYTEAAAGSAAPALHRLMELRSFLALAEEQVTRLRDRLHEVTGPAAGQQLPVDQLRFDVQLLEAALSARGDYLDALDQMLQSVPAPTARPAPGVQFTQPKATLRPAGEDPPPAPPPASRARRP